MGAGYAESVVVLVFKSTLGATAQYSEQSASQSGVGQNLKRELADRADNIETETVKLSIMS